MPLGDISAFQAWKDRERPPPALVRAVRWWIVGLAVAPWQAPSVPIDASSNQPEYEARSALLDVGVLVLYRQEYVTGSVDLLWVGKV